MDDITKDENVTQVEEEEKSLTRDETLDITSLIKSSKSSEEDTSDDVISDSLKTEEKKLTPLEEKLKRKSEGGDYGLIVDNKELEAANAPKEPLKDKHEDDSDKEVSVYQSEQDDLIEAAMYVKVINKPSGPIEMAQMMDDVEYYKNNKKLPEKGPNDKVFIAEKTEEEIENSEVNNTPATNTVGDPEVNEEVDKEKEELVSVLIDKTGLGGDFQFTDEEREKLVKAKEIRLTEIEEVELSSITVKKPDRSFLDSVNDFQLSTTSTPCAFPGSRFRAYMAGMSYGEMGDIINNSETISFDQAHKKLSVIYNKMKNPSIGEFESFEDFLKKFSYIDQDLATYGLVVSTFPEIDEIPLNCRNESCGRQFNHTFSPRQLIRFEKSGIEYLNALKDVGEASGIMAQELFRQSPVNVHKRYKLPYTGFLVEVGLASAYEWLYTIIENSGEKFKEKYPDDQNGILQLNSALLGLIRAVYVPDPVDPSQYIIYDDFDDMIQALYYIKPDEIIFLGNLLEKYISKYTPHFEIRNVVCPHCGTKTEFIPVDISTLVFIKYRTLMSTQINYDNIQVL